MALSREVWALPESVQVWLLRTLSSLMGEHGLGSVYGHCILLFNGKWREGLSDLFKTQFVSYSLTSLQWTFLCGHELSALGQTIYKLGYYQHAQTGWVPVMPHVPEAEAGESMTCRSLPRRLGSEADTFQQWAGTINLLLFRQLLDSTWVYIQGWKAFLALHHWDRHSCELTACTNHTYFLAATSDPAASAAASASTASTHNLCDF